MKRRLAWTGVSVLTLATLVLLFLFVPAHTLSQASGIELFLMVLPATYFPIFYSAAFRWWETHLGRALFIKGAGLGLLIDISVIYVIFGDDYPYREHVRFFVFTFVLIGLYYQSIVMTKIRIMRDREANAGTGKDLAGVRST